MSRQLPMVSTRPLGRARRTDFARGRTGLLAWVAPLTLLVVASALGSVGRISTTLEGLLLIVGTSLFGGLCLVNALECGRTHCWIDGVGLPALALIGGLGVVGVIPISWGTFLSTLWAVVGLSFLAECIYGPYLPTRPVRQ
jgi:hypothetical protein